MLVIIQNSYLITNMDLLEDPVFIIFMIILSIVGIVIGYRSYLEFKDMD